MIVFDLETTDLMMPTAAALDKQPHIIEFGAIKLDENLKEIGRKDFLIKPPISIPEKITQITGITNEMVKDKAPFAGYYHVLCDFFRGEKAIIAHNLEFDKSVLVCELRRMGKDHTFPWPYVQKCTVEASFYLHNKRMSLGDLHQELVGNRFNGAHRSMADVEALVSVVRKLTEMGAL